MSGSDPGGSDWHFLANGDAVDPERDGPGPGTSSSHQSYCATCATYVSDVYSCVSLALQYCCHLSNLDGRLFNTMISQGTK